MKESVIYHIGFARESGTIRKVPTVLIIALAGLSFICSRITSTVGYIRVSTECAVAISTRCNGHFAGTCCNAFQLRPDALFVFVYIHPALMKFTVSKLSTAYTCAETIN
jgi:hypothetical protein